MGKYEYQKLTMGICNSHDNFQYNIYILYEGLDMVHVYTYNLLNTTKYDAIDHLKAQEKYL